jgi:integrase/recombinase XerD
MSTHPIRSYARANRELSAAFGRYMVAKGNSPQSIRAYLDAVNRLVTHLGATSIAEVDRTRIRELLTQMFEKGLSESSVNLHTSALRLFFKFIRETGLTKHDPMLAFAHRKLPIRLPVVLSVEECERLIAAGENPFERTVPEVLYSTGVRVAELVKLRIEDINWDSRSIRVINGKGGKDRIVLFGSKAAAAIREYVAWRPSRSGYLFEPEAQAGSLSLQKRGPAWYARFYVDGVQHEIRIGKVRNGEFRDLPTREDARLEFQRVVTEIPGYQLRPAKPYTPMAIRLLLNKLAHRAGIKHVHPHALRRAMAGHMLQRGGNLRAIQDLLGHTNLSSTMRYTWLSADHLQKVHENYHPKGDKANGEKK